ncbi:MAG: hypothetical protein U5K54_29955 [Cytophagales bacterium]|nr:hypothetical protein [Cytophagales bacterium]
MHYGQIFQSHALPLLLPRFTRFTFWYGCARRKRNVIAVAIENKELAKKGILMRKFGQEIIQAIAGKKSMA